MDLVRTITELLAQPDTLEDEDPTRLEQLVEEHGQPAVLTELLRALRDDGRSSEWPGAAIVLWGCVLDRWELPVDEVIALLWHRLQLDRADEDNLVWSITAKLKGVSYLASYSAIHDPGVRAHLLALGRVL